MEPEGPVVFWTTQKDAEDLRHDNIDDAVAEFIDDCFPERPPGKITVYGYARAKVVPCKYSAETALENLLDQLDEEYGGDDRTEPTPGMKEAAEDFVERIRSLYLPWACICVEQREVEIVLSPGGGDYVVSSR